MHFVFMFDHFKMGEEWHMSIWTPFKFKLGVNLQKPLQCTSFKWNAQHIITMNMTLYHLIMCLCIVNYVDHFVFIICYRIEVEPESEITPSVEDTPYDPRQQGKQTPIDHVDKIPLPSQYR